MYPTVPLLPIKLQVCSCKVAVALVGLNDSLVREKRIVKYFWKEKKLLKITSYVSLHHITKIPNLLSDALNETSTTKIFYQLFLNETSTTKIVYQLFTNLMLNLDATYLQGR